MSSFSQTGLNASGKKTFRFKAKKESPQQKAERLERRQKKESAKKIFRWWKRQQFLRERVSASLVLQRAWRAYSTQKDKIDFVAPLEDEAETSVVEQPQIQTQTTMTHATLSLTHSPDPQMDRLLESSQEVPQETLPLSEEEAGTEIEEATRKIAQAIKDGDLALVEQLVLEKHNLTPSPPPQRRQKKQRRARTPRTPSPPQSRVKVAITEQEDSLIQFLVESHGAEWFPLSEEGSGHQFFEKKVRGVGDFHTTDIQEVLTKMVETAHLPAGAGSLLKDKKGWTLRQGIGGKTAERTEPIKTSQIVNGGEFFLGWKKNTQEFKNLITEIQRVFFVEKVYQKENGKKKSIWEIKENWGELVQPWTEDSTYAWESHTQQQKVFTEVNSEWIEVVSVEEPHAEEVSPQEEEEDSDSEAEEGAVEKECEEVEFKGQTYYICEGQIYTDLEGGQDESLLEGLFLNDAGEIEEER